MQLILHTKWEDRFPFHWSWLSAWLHNTHQCEWIIDGLLYAHDSMNYLATSILSGEIWEVFLVSDSSIAQSCNKSSGIIAYGITMSQACARMFHNHNWVSFESTSLRLLIFATMDHWVQMYADKARSNQNSVLYTKHKIRFTWKRL